MKEALLYEQLKDNQVQCHVCNHHCTILPNKRGTCGVRENKNGKLYLLVYGKVISAAVDPIEKKPFFHFMPGSRSYSIATVGCNFRCDNCQNWQISQASKQSGYTDLKITGEDITPEQVVDGALASESQSIAYTYTEPTIWMDFALDCMKLAHQKGLKNVWVSNGFMSDKTLELILPYLDAINVDLKFFDTKKYQKICGAKLEPILDNLIALKKNNVWVEVTTLAIPTLSDSPETFQNIASFINKKLGSETPWHISAFSPEISYKMQDLPATSIATLKTAYQIGKKAGLKYVYTGNIPGLDSEHTYCPECNAVVIERLGFRTNRHDHDGNCPDCNSSVDCIQ